MFEDGLHPRASHVREDAPLSTAARALQDVDGESAAQKVRPIQLSARGLSRFHIAGSTGELCAFLMC